MEQSDRNGKIWPKNLVKLFHVVWYLHWCFRRWKRPNHLSLTSMSSFPGLELSSSANGVFASSAISFSKINFIGSFCNLIYINPDENTGTIPALAIDIIKDPMKLDKKKNKRLYNQKEITHDLHYDHVLRFLKFILQSQPCNEYNNNPGRFIWSCYTKCLTFCHFRSPELGKDRPTWVFQNLQPVDFFWFRMDGGISSSTTTTKSTSRHSSWYMSDFHRISLYSLIWDFFGILRQLQIWEHG